MTRGERLLFAGQAALLVGSIALAAVTSTADQWEPVGLVVLLAVGTVATGLFPILVKNAKAHGTSIGLTLAMALLGPAPAVAIGVLAMLTQAIRTKPPWQTLLCNTSTFALFPLVGGFAFLGFQSLGVTEGDFGLPLSVAAVFLVANVVNFAALAVDFAVTEGRSIRRNIREVYVPALPVEVASALLTGSLAAIYAEIGMGFAALLIVVALVFQYLLHLTFESRRRGEQLERRTKELAALQIGLLTTVVKTLSLRDKMTARHSAAVARYARELARMRGMSPEEQDVVHTAALLHDIGKFVFPDSILFANRRLTNEDYEIVKTHPARGAELVGQIEGYGPVAEIILAHHERIDGKGYPHGLAGEEIPLAARMISIADTYDVMVSRDSYRDPVSSEDAIAELERVAGTQLDAELVALFVRLLREKNVAFVHADDSDFERELNLEQRVRDYAAPRIAA